MLVKGALGTLIHAAALAAVIGVQAPGGAVAGASEAFSSPAVTAKLISAQDGVAQGVANISAGLDLDLAKGWKTYWRSPGEVGIPPQVDWAGSDNVAKVEVFWPAPTRFTAFGIENFGYQDEVVFPLRIQLERPGDPATLAAAVTLLTCSDVCVPQDFALTLTLPRGNGLDQQAADRIGAFSARVPLEGDTAALTSAHAHVDSGKTELTVALQSAVPFDAPDVFPEMGTGTALGKPDIRLGEEGHLLWARFPVLALNEDSYQPPVLTVTNSPGRAFTVTPEPADRPLTPPFTVKQLAPGLAHVAWIAAIALLGGLILNVMPCVLPVLSIKLSSALRQQGRSPMTVRGGFLAAAGGVMVFMWGLSAVLFVLQRLGLAVGWGLQFQSPAFLALMFVILMVFSANLFGMFQINLPSSLLTKLSRAGGGNGYGSDFLTGLFGAVMATPCSAPFLGTAVAFALAGRGVDLVLVFTSLGVGLATPYLVLAASPGLVRLLPKPGRWMIGVKLVLGGLLVVTALWLIWVLIGVAGPAAAAAAAGLTAILILTLAWNRPSPWLRWSGIAVFTVLPLLAATTLSQPASVSKQQELHDWVRFDRGEIARLVSRGEVVFVDVTADWCLTCKANKALVLDREPVLSALESADVTTMQADWTRPDATISRYLEQFNRYGIPFNAVYGPAAPDGIVLSEILSASSVLDALEDARLASPVIGVMR